ncbi:MAG: nitronate monooxygenase, partial [Gammaproteobacteria bacterium]|nr:nitronate monooxygenase [Gammaproteobacteria bacterium]
MWPNRDLLDLFNIELPVIQAPMAGCNGAELAAVVSETGGLGSLPCAMLSIDEIKSEVEYIRSTTSKPFNINFFCHRESEIDSESIQRWRDCLAPYYQEFDLEFQPEYDKASRQPFDDAACELMEELKPPVISFHFGLPPENLFQRVKRIGCRIMSTATTVA